MAKRALNFRKMALAELVRLRDEIETALNGKIVGERKELESRIAQLAALDGKRSGRGGRPVGRPKPRTLATAGRKRKPHPLKGRKAKPKYRGPGGETWAGRGLTPRWLVDLEKKGKKREQFLIAK